MSDISVVLIQKSGSPLVPVIAEAAARVLEQPLLTIPAPPLPPIAAQAGLLAVWDLWGFDAPERQAWEPELALPTVGVVLALPHAEPELAALALRLGALGLITAELSASVAGLVLELARIHQERICRLLAEQASLEQQMAEREVIERAKRVLMASLQISEAEAMQRLQKQARNTNQRLVQVAQRVLSSYRLFNGKPE
ncbi:MAG: ANTAR domain-containing protein [Thermodesulfobacteriota bacterium]